MVINGAKQIASSKTTKSLELADVFRQYGSDFLSTRRVAARHSRVMQQIVNCRTETLGGHRQWCARCGFHRYLYHSCRNRHCPKCQTAAKEAWREARQLELLPVPYFHNVFTLPHEFNALILKSESNQKILLKLLFDSAARTLLDFGEAEMQGQVGFTMVLHTWDQQLRPHCHLHWLIASGALARDRSRWIAGGSRFLFSVRGISKMFRGKFLSGFKRLLDEDALDLVESIASPLKQRQLVRQLFRKSWVVYSKAPFAGPAKFLDYLSRYTHRVAITNSRLKACRNGEVTFTYRDRRDGDRCKQLAIPVNQFIARFLTHVLPKRFMRIRHFGFMANRNRKRNLAAIRKLIGFKTIPREDAQSSTVEQWLKNVVGVDLQRCPCCGDELIESDIPSQLIGSPVANPLSSLRNAMNLTRGSPC